MAGHQAGHVVRHISPLHEVIEEQQNGSIVE